MTDPRQENQSSAYPPFDENPEAHQETRWRAPEEGNENARTDSFPKEPEPEAYTSSPPLSRSVFFEVLPSKKQYGRMILSSFFSLGMLGLFIFAGFGIYFIATGGRTFYNGVPTEGVDSSYLLIPSQTVRGSGNRGGRRGGRAYPCSLL